MVMMAVMVAAAESDISRLEPLQQAGLKVAELAQPDHSILYRITGNAHPHRHGLRAAGGSWNKIKQCWEFTCATDADSPLPRIAATANHLISTSMAFPPYAMRL
jgi:hypothetical protein